MLRPLLCFASAASLATLAFAQTPDTVPAPPPGSARPTEGAASSPEEAPALSEEITPFSVWLDFNVLARPDAEHPALPVWFESFQELRDAGSATTPPSTTFRLRLRRMPTLHRELLLRIYFDDLPEMQPTVTAWSESGRQRFSSGVLGHGLAL